MSYIAYRIVCRDAGSAPYTSPPPYDSLRLHSVNLMHVTPPTLPALAGPFDACPCGSHVHARTPKPAYAHTSHTHVSYVRIHTMLHMHPSVGNVACTPCPHALAAGPRQQPQPPQQPASPSPLHPLPRHATPCPPTPPTNSSQTAPPHDGRRRCRCPCPCPCCPYRLRCPCCRPAPATRRRPARPAGPAAAA